MEKIKYVHRQDSGFKLSAGNSGETSLNLSNEIFDLITKGSMNLGEERNVTFKLYKEDCIKAVCFIILKLPLYQSSSKSSVKVVDNLVVFQNLIGKINDFFGENEIVDYTVNLYYRTDGRIYLNRLKVDGFSIRDVLVENNSALLFKEESNGKIALRILSDIKDGETVDAVEQEIQPSLPLQQIFYGAPGTGKSHSVKKVTGELLEDGTEVERDNVFRTTFHPDTDYASFVGCYKPTMKPTTNEQKTITGKKEEIVYEFVPQVFTDAYVYAYNNPDKDTYLVIEEINRGNCVQIFGDLFQLLDRKRGVSEYKIKADKDLATYLLEAKDDKGNDILTDKIGILNGKLCLPANLNILATMNTSDQSLFPMDSAFKRRWEWEYVVIDYDEPKSKGFEIILSEDKKYNWCDFIKQVNKRIFALTQSEDKEMGNFFIKNSINAEQFKSKVMFYLWYEVLRDEVENSKYFFYYIQQDEDTGKESTKKFTYKELYGDKAETILDGFLRYIAKGAVE